MGRLLDIIKGLEESNGKSDGQEKNHARRDWIEHWLYQKKLRSVVHDGHTIKVEEGEIGIHNLIVPLYEAPLSLPHKVIGIGSHYDAVRGSPGGNDNGSAVAVCLELINRFQSLPAKNLETRFFFFDQEEGDLSIGIPGIAGSTAYVSQLKDKKSIIGFYNMELIGMGETFCMWGHDPERPSRLMDVFESSAKSHEPQMMTYRIPIVLLHDADHRPFRQAGIDAFTITAVPKADLTVYLQYLAAAEKAERKDRSALWQNTMYKTRIFKDYHKRTDSYKNLSEETLIAAADLLEMSIRSIDSALR